MTKTPTPAQVDTLRAIAAGSVRMVNCGHAAYRIHGAPPQVVGRLVQSLKWARWPRGPVAEQTCELTDAGAAVLAQAAGKAPAAAELAYDIEASHYPEDEPEAVTAQITGLLAEIADRRRQVMDRPEPDPDFPQIGRYRELALAVECLIDCAGYPFPDYRQKLVGVAALALDALIAFDGAPAAPATA